MKSNLNDWDLDTIKKEHPEASRRVALSIISNSTEGVTFDRYRYDSKAIWVTSIVNNWKYHYFMIFIAWCHCGLGFVEQSITFDPYSSSISFLSPYVTLPLELIIIFIYSVDCFLRFQTARWPPWTHAWLMLKSILSIIFLLDVILAYIYIRQASLEYYNGKVHIKVVIISFGLLVKPGKTTF